MGHPEVMSSEGERLGQYVLARRKYLDLTQVEVWQAGGPSNTTLSSIENGELVTLTRTTARKLDKGLQWEPGGARAVWAGAEPTPLKAAPEFLSSDKDVAAVREYVLGANIEPEVRERVLRALEAG